jgi:hypothetical protein
VSPYYHHQNFPSNTQVHLPPETPTHCFCLPFPQAQSDARKERASSKRDRRKERMDNRDVTKPEKEEKA